MAKVMDILDVRDGGGQKKYYDKIGLLRINDEGKMSIYLPIVGKWFQVMERRPRDGNEAAGNVAPAAPSREFDDEVPF